MKFNLRKKIKSLKDVKRFNKHCFDKWGGSYHPHDFETYKELQETHTINKVPKHILYRARLDECESLDSNFFWNDLINLGKISFFNKVGKNKYF